MGCSTIEQVEDKPSACLITFEEMSAAKAQLGEDEATVTLAGNTFTIGAGMMRGFYGDWAHDYTVVYDPPCHLDDKLRSEYNTETISVITLVWSSWKDEPVDVYPNQSSPPKGYFNPPSPYEYNK